MAKVLINNDKTIVNLIATSKGCYCGPEERRLLNDLIMNYNKLERPVANESEAIQLRFGLTLQQIMNVVSDIQTYFTLLCFPPYRKTYSHP